MNVSLTKELEQWIENRVGSGLYRSSSEVVREALRLLREREELKELRREELRRMIQAGVDDFASGRSEALSAELIEGVIAGRRAAREKS